MTVFSQYGSIAGTINIGNLGREFDKRYISPIIDVFGHWIYQRAVSAVAQ